MTAPPVQMPFDLPVREALGRDDFFVSPANAAALAQIDAWTTWPQGRLVLAGPSGSGKTHLAHVWAGMSGAPVLPATDLTEASVPGLVETRALVLEDADRAEDETALFHLMNLMAAEGGALLITARAAPSHWATKLPDLRSRLEAAPLARLEAPDDALLRGVLLKHFTDRQFDPPEKLIAYLLPRIERSFEAASQIVSALDAESLARKQPITRSLAARLLDKGPSNTP